MPTVTVRKRVLEALLDTTVRGNPQLRCLDVTRDGSAALCLRERSGHCDTDPGPGLTYGLVVCDAPALDRALRFTAEQGAVLLFVPRGQAPCADTLAHLDPVAQVRCPQGEWRLVRRQLVTAQQRPTVSLVLTVQDQAPALARLASHLVDEPGDPTWELVIVDRGSFDVTAELLRALRGDLVSLRSSRATSAETALATGAERARGQLVVLLNVDRLPRPGFVGALVEGARTHPGADVFASQARPGHGDLLGLRADLLGTATLRSVLSTPALQLPGFCASTHSSAA